MSIMLEAVLRMPPEVWRNDDPLDVIQRHNCYIEAADRIAELERRMVHMASSTADDWRWYQNQARQACRALGIERSELDWS